MPTQKNTARVDTEALFKLLDYVTIKNVTMACKIAGKTVYCDVTKSAAREAFREYVGSAQRWPIQFMSKDTWLIIGTVKRG